MGHRKQNILRSVASKRGDDMKKEEQERAAHWLLKELKDDLEDILEEMEHLGISMEPEEYGHSAGPSFRGHVRERKLQIEWMERMMKEDEDCLNCGRRSRE